LRALHLVKTSVGADWAYRQMRELTRLGVEVHVALPPGGPLVPCYERAGVVVHPVPVDLPVRSPWRCPSALRATRRLVARVRPDVIHSHFVGTTLTVRLALGRRHPTPRVFQVPGPLHLEHAFFREAELWTAGPSDHWIGTCQWICDRYRRSGVAADRVFLGHHGYDTVAFGRGPTGKLRRELGAGPGTKLVGMVAYMYAPKRYLGQARGLKGHEDLIDALVICRQAVPDLLAVFVGGPWGDAGAYERRVRAYGRRRLGDRARFLGTRDDVAEIYPDLDVVAHPSHSEGVGGAAESLLSAVPTVASAVGGLLDFIEPGVTGWLVPPHDPPALAAAILDALGSPDRARAMADRGRARAREGLDIRANARRVLEIYRSLAGP
jgi:glycosyltransferase involved in cell wall biosynthesis